MTTTAFRKDVSLDRLADQINVAQFVSFSPRPLLEQQFCRILGYSPNHRFSTVRSAIAALLRSSAEQSLNIRSFLVTDPRSHDFFYGLKSIDDVEGVLNKLSIDGLFTIVNETIDINDGGVSGVSWGGAVEFAPDDTPRCVEKPGVASLPTDWAEAILQKVYGFHVPIDLGKNTRLEFSLHPKRRGWKDTHILGWELETEREVVISATSHWPNSFSRFIGDKTFGLLMAEQAGLLVPRTTVISRRLAPFTFGTDTGAAERWIRTCPKEQVPGRFTTHHGWLDPFALLQKEDPSGRYIASILAQHAVQPYFSGALIVGADGQPIVEGKKGEGEDFMLGVALPEKLPNRVKVDVLSVYDAAFKVFGPVRFEWVHDGEQVWVVQFHRGATTTTASILVPGDANQWRKFEVHLGLEKLRQVLELLAPDEGIVLIGEIGLTSHIADVVRLARRPARVVPVPEGPGGHC